jgi:serine/threonine-protein kinase
MAHPMTSQSRLGRYAILERLAAGGMAEIFLACERGVRGLERIVVVKRILPHLALQPSFVDMFVQEAKIVALLNHPNVVQIYELAETETGEVYISMEYVPGSTLRQLTDVAQEKGRVIPVDVTLGMVLQACKGAHAAHELRDQGGRPLGLVHRDISPHNLMVTSAGHVKLLDFGIAKATEGLEHTATGTLKGKYCYMSPEQARHESLDRRSDVFALGIVLWELIAGQRLFKRDSELASMNAIVTEDVERADGLRPDVPGRVADTVARALARKREERTPTAEQLRLELLDAAQSANLDVSEDRVGSFVRELLGEQHSARGAAVDAAVEKTLRMPTHSDSTRHPQRLQSDAASRELMTTPDRPLVMPGAAPANARGAQPPAHSRRHAVLVSAAAALLGAVVAWSGLMITLGPGLGGLRLGGQGVLGGRPVMVGFPPVMDAALLQRELEPLRVYLEKALQRPVQFPVTATYDELAAKVLSGDHQFGSFPPYLYLKTRERSHQVELLVFKQFRGSSGTDGVLLVPETASAQDISELATKRFCFADRSSLTGYILPRAALQLAGVNLQQVDQVARISGDHLQVLRDLNAGLCDAGATYSGAYLAADRAGVPVARLRVLAVTGRSPHDAICSGPASSPADRKAMLQALLEFKPSSHVGAETLGEVQQISGFVVGDDDAYRTLRVALTRAGALGSDPPP